MDSTPRRSLSGMSRRELRALRLEVEGNRASLDDDEMRYTTFDFVRRGLHDPGKGPMQPFLDMTDSRESALKKAAQEKAEQAAKEEAERLTLERRSRVSDGVRPFLDFHAGQKRVEWLRQYRGQDFMIERVEVLRDNVTTAQKDVILNPCDETVAALEKANEALRDALDGQAQTEESS